MGCRTRAVGTLLDLYSCCRYRGGTRYAVCSGCVGILFMRHDIVFLIYVPDRRCCRMPPARSRHVG